MKKRSKKLFPTWGLLIAVTVLRIWFASVVPLSPDEAYYWVWSRALAPGYLDHPPMVALWIWLGTAIAGDTALGIRLLSPVAALAGTWLLARAAEDLLPHRNAGWTAAALLNATLLFGIGAVTMTPDTPLLFFWTLALFALARLLASGDPRWWLLAGTAIGLASASKYTAALLALAVAAWTVATPAIRPALRRWHPWAAAALALALFSPVLAWNASHDWASFAKQGGRTGAIDITRAPQFLGELLAGQAGLATPIIFALCLAGTIHAVRHARAPNWALLTTLTLVPAAVFLQHALGDRVQANWPAILYPAAAIAAAGLPAAWQRWTNPGIALGAALTVMAYIQAAFAPIPLPMRLDPTLLRLGGWADLAHDVAAAREDGFVASDNYGHAALLALLLPPTVPVYAIDPRWALFDLPAANLAGRSGLLLRSARRDDTPSPEPWSAITRLGTIDRARHGMTAEVFRLYRVTGRPTPGPESPRPEPIVALPRPR